MLGLLRNWRIKKYTKKASDYIRNNYILPASSYKSDSIRYSLADDDGVMYSRSSSDYDDGELYSKQSTEDDNNTKTECSDKIDADDKYNAAEVLRALRNYPDSGDYNEIISTLERNVNQTFVDRLLYYINKRGVRDSKVYKAAQVDKRLFSKMVSNREYKPSKDTAVALALALELTLDEANDMLDRAGYTFSHSNKRDIIIEFFFREKIYNLIDANDILYKLNQKLIGRF